MIKRLTIMNLFNDVDIDIRFNDTINILVGDNGAYKTTILSIINYIGRGDFESLFRIKFDKLKLEYTSSDDESINILEFIVDDDGVTGKLSFDGNIIETGYDDDGELNEEQYYSRILKVDSDDIEYDFDIDEDILDSEDYLLHSEIIDREFSLTVDELIKYKANPLVSFLPVSRYKYLEDNYSGNKLQKDIAILLNKLTHYRNEEYLKFSSRFKECVFRELFKTDVGSKSRSKKLNFEVVKSEEIEELSDFLKEMDVDWGDNYFNEFKKKYEKAKKQHLEIEKLEEGKEQQYFFEMFTGKKSHEYLYFMENSHQMSLLRELIVLMREWNEIEKGIMERKENFLKMINDYFSYNENIEFKFINGDNLYCIKKLRDGVKTLNLNQLSSGEKCIIQIFAEGKLNLKNSIHTLIIDEPELSLHIEWQERLLEDFIKSEKALQIIVATHSPSILEKFNTDEYIVEEYAFREEGIVKYEC